MDLASSKNYVTEDEIIGWHYRLNGHESEQAPGDGEGKTQEPGVLQPMKSQRVRHDLATEPQYTPF